MGNAYTCTPNQCQSGSACNGTGGCLFANKPDGSGCNDGNACSYGDDVRQPGPVVLGLLHRRPRDVQQRLLLGRRLLQYGLLLLDVARAPA
jgi:hypothetical protein